MKVLEVAYERYHHGSSIETLTCDARSRVYLPEAILCSFIHIGATSSTFVRHFGRVMTKKRVLKSCALSRASIPAWFGLGSSSGVPPAAILV